MSTKRESPSKRELLDSLDERLAELYKMSAMNALSDSEQKINRMISISQQIDYLRANRDRIERSK